MNKIIITETSIVNFSRLLCVVINRKPHTRAHSEADCRLIFDTGKEVAVTVKLAEDLMQAMWREAGFSPTTEYQSEQSRTTDASAVSSAD